MPSADGRAFARAALAGNPSDGYGGATLAVVIPNFSAEVRIETSAEPGVTPPSPLVAGTIERFAREHAVADDVAASWRTTVPREVGLAGSSAIVTAALRALCELHDVRLEPPQLAASALAIETDVLGIAAGLQDRVAQAYGGLTYMDFEPGYFDAHGHGRYEQLDTALLPPLYVAYREDARGQSGGIHGPLRTRFEAGDPEIVEAMAQLASHALDARDALKLGDGERFGRCVDASFDVRRRIVELDARHVAMVERARSLGASANYTGSGGAIVGACRDGRHRDAVVAALRADGAAAIVPDIG
jgi:glucuronokinase